MNVDKITFQGDERGVKAARGRLERLKRQISFEIKPEGIALTATVKDDKIVIYPTNPNETIAGYGPCPGNVASEGSRIVGCLPRGFPEGLEEEFSVIISGEHPQNYILDYIRRRTSLVL
ncbi:MAG: hypothetical protein KKF56_00240 [Nanoarchaeota archaeon]|nr:hypothetical protein [Nanoarchaeota archaeon]